MLLHQHRPSTENSHKRQVCAESAGQNASNVCLRYSAQWLCSIFLLRPYEKLHAKYLLFIFFEHFVVVVAAAALKKVEDTPMFINVRAREAASSTTTTNRANAKIISCDSIQSQCIDTFIIRRCRAFSTQSLFCFHILRSIDSSPWLVVAQYCMCGMCSIISMVAAFIWCVCLCVRARARRPLLMMAREKQTQPERANLSAYFSAMGFVANGERRRLEVIAVLIILFVFFSISFVRICFKWNTRTDHRSEYFIRLQSHSAL